MNGYSILIVDFTGTARPPFFILLISCPHPTPPLGLPSAYLLFSLLLPYLSAVPLPPVLLISYLDFCLLGLHRVWAKYEDESWTYADQDGNLVNNPLHNSKQESSNHHHEYSSRPSRSRAKSSGYKRNRVTYQDIYEEEEGQVSSEGSDRKKHRHKTKHMIDPQEDAGLDSIEEALLDFHESIPAPQPPRPYPIRLLVLPQSRASSIDLNRNLLILQPGADEPMIFGRDRTFEPSLRLKEMEVSKTHATIFWRAFDEPQSHGWYILDNASTHGTFISSPDDHPRASPTRLSKVRKTSVPYKLGHLDTIYIASVDDPILALQVHLHPRFPSSCQSCALFPDESNRMSLESASAAAGSTNSIEERGEERYAMSPADVKLERERKRKIEMAKLRNQFFGHDSESNSKKSKKGDPLIATTTAQQDEDEHVNQPTPSQYLDRAKLRRQALGRSEPPSNKGKTVAPPAAKEIPEPEPMKRGVALLAKLGGASDSIKNMGKVIEAKTLGNTQAGLGSREMIVGVEKINGPKDWREEAKLANWRRYESLKQK